MCRFGTILALGDGLGPFESRFSPFGAEFMENHPLAGVLIAHE
jgi:hypothetical protein